MFSWLKRKKPPRLILNEISVKSFDGLNGKKFLLVEFAENGKVSFSFTMNSPDRVAQFGLTLHQAMIDTWFSDGPLDFAAASKLQTVGNC